MKRILIASYDLEVGGVERSLISMLEKFDYNNIALDLFLYRQQGDFMHLLPKVTTLLNEISHYATFRKSIRETIHERHFGIAFSRIISKLVASVKGRKKSIEEPGYYQMQLMWKYALPFLPRMHKEYDVAISYLWPHYFIADKVIAKRKIAWIHTDFSNVETDVALDLKMWNKFDFIVAVSEACRQSFLEKYGVLKEKVSVIENITSPEFIRKMAVTPIDNPMDKDNRFKIVTVARLSHAKGIDNAVKALKLLKNKGLHNLAWYVVGYGGDEESIKALIKESNLQNDFILLGKKTNPYPYMYASDLYVQPSRYEGKAVTVTEAQILGKPVLITNYATAKSQIHDQYNGYISELSVEGIAYGIEKLFYDIDLRNRLKQNCVNTDFNNTDELDKLYKLIG